MIKRLKPVEDRAMDAADEDDNPNFMTNPYPINLLTNRNPNRNRDMLHYPFTRHNRLSNRLNNRLNNRLYRVNVNGVHT